MHYAKPNRSMSLFAEILKHGTMAPGVTPTGIEGGNPQNNEDFAKLARSAQCFDITNVASYLYEASTQESWRLEEHFPNLAPPFPTCWFEWKSPRFSNSEGELIEFDAASRSLRWAALVSAQDFETDMSSFGVTPEMLKSVDLARIDEEYKKLMAEVEELTVQPLKQLLRQKFLWALSSLAKGARWMVDVYPFCGGGITNGACRGPSVKMTFTVGSDGRIVRGPRDLIVTGGAYTQAARDSMLAEGSMPTQLVFPALLAISFMHCRNVKLVATQTQRHKKATKRGDPVIDYRTLVISPMKEVLKQATQKEGGSDSLQRALHICRGHFKTYTEARPLLGKHVGTFWWKDNVRGTTQAGLVAKHYSVQGRGEA